MLIKQRMQVSTLLKSTLPYFDWKITCIAFVAKVHNDQRENMSCFNDRKSGDDFCSTTCLLASPDSIQILLRTMPRVMF